MRTSSGSLKVGAYDIGDIDHSGTVDLGDAILAHPGIEGLVRNE